MESRFANALDWLQPLIQNASSGGGSWRMHDLTRDDVLRRMAPIETAMPEVWPTVVEIVDAFCAAGVLQSSGSASRIRAFPKTEVLKSMKDMKGARHVRAVPRQRHLGGTIGTSSGAALACGLFTPFTFFMPFRILLFGNALMRTSGSGHYLRFAFARDSS